MASREDVDNARKEGYHRGYAKADGEWKTWLIKSIIMTVLLPTIAFILAFFVTRGM